MSNSHREFSYEDFKWHSAIGIDKDMDGKKRFYTRLPNTKQARSMFAIDDDNSKFLIHKTTQALWRVSDDGDYIERVFDSDILSEDDVK